MLKDAISQAAKEEVVPFLRRIQSEIEDGRDIADAYNNALSDTKVIKHLIGDLPKNKPFTEALGDAAKQSKLRMLVVFANQVYLNEKQSGSLKEALKKSIATTEIMDSLQTDVSKQHNTHRRQKQLLALGGVAAAAVLANKYLRRR